MDWTNLVTTTKRPWVATQRLASVGSSTNRVQALWMEQTGQFAETHGPFPTHAKLLQTTTEQIVRDAKSTLPNLKVMHLPGLRHCGTGVGL